MFGLGVTEIAIILFIALIFIGPKKLPELAKGLGKGIREFQNAAKGIQESINTQAPSQEAPTTQAVTQTEESLNENKTETKARV